MKDKKVTHISSHIGIGNTAMTSVNAKSHEAEMELTPVGVYVKLAGPAPKRQLMEYLVPFSNLRWIQLETTPEEEAEFAGEEPKKPKQAKSAKSA